MALRKCRRRVLKAQTQRISFAQAFGKTAPLIVRGWTKKYGKTYGMYEGVVPVYITSDMDILNDVFNKKFSYFHGRKVRKKGNFSFKNYTVLLHHVDLIYTSGLFL